VEHERNVVAAVVSTAATALAAASASTTNLLRLGSLFIPSPETEGARGQRWIDFSEDDIGAGAPSRRRPTARGRAVSIANALSRLRQGYGEPGDNAFQLGYFER